MAGWRTVSLAALTVALGLTPAARAEAPSLSVTGSFKSIAGVRRLRQSELFERSTDPITEQRVRLGTSAQWRTIFVEAAQELSLFHQSPNDPRILILDSPRHGMWSDWKIVDGSGTLLLHRVDRAFARMTLGTMEAAVGRQVLPGGVGQIFSPVGQVPLHSFVRIDPEYRIAQDALLLSWNAGPRVELAVVGNGERQRRANFFTRLSGNLRGYDAAIRAGQSDDKPYLGAELAGNLGDALFRAEGVAYHWRESARFQAMAGLEKVLSPKVSARAELFYNGFGTSQPYLAEPFPHIYSPLRGLWYGGLGASWDPSARIKLMGLALTNLGDPSALFQFALAYNISENMDVLVGQFLSVGGGRSEFGGRQALAVAPQFELGIPDITYAEVKIAL